nr:hypothetical protein CFP56_03297 [Quercus suber]
MWSRRRLSPDYSVGMESSRARQAGLGEFVSLDAIGRLSGKTSYCMPVGRCTYSSFFGVSPSAVFTRDRAKMLDGIKGRVPAGPDRHDWTIATSRTVQYTDRVVWTWILAAAGESRRGLETMASCAPRSRPCPRIQARGSLATMRDAESTSPTFHSSMLVSPSGQALAIPQTSGQGVHRIDSDLARSARLDGFMQISSAVSRSRGPRARSEPHWVDSSVGRRSPQSGMATEAPAAENPGRRLALLYGMIGASV